ncbi:MAG: branched-chain amino acid ABC transporter permease [Thermoleophilia bacterium]|nr:branched-chain amino acid ABC transporter permease [Thermoleophilia bacterium]
MIAAVPQGFRKGFLAMAPLWLGVIPFGLAYAVTARDAGLSVLETQVLSLVLFAGSAQVAAVGLMGAGAAALEIVLTTFLLNVRHLLYGVSLARTVPLRPREVPIVAFLLTDEAFGVAAARGARTFRFLFGTELSLFFTWNLATLVGALAASEIPDPAALGVDIVFPLAFLALLVPLLHTRVELLVALSSGALAWVLAQALSAGPAILLTGVGGALLGAALVRGRPPGRPTR